MSFADVSMYIMSLQCFCLCGGNQEITSIAKYFDHPSYMKLLFKSKQRPLQSNLE